MEHEVMRAFIAENGYKTLTEIKAKFTEEDMEIVEMKLTFLVEKNKVRKAEFNGPEGNDFLYYIPRQ